MQLNRQRTQKYSSYFNIIPHINQNFFIKKTNEQSVISIWKDICNQIFNFGYKAQKLETISQKLTQMKITKQQYYHYLSEAVQEQLDRVINTIDFVKKKTDSQIVQQKQEKQIKFYEISDNQKLTKTLFHIDKNCKEIQKLIKIHQKYFQWGCSCNRQICINRYKDSQLYFSAKNYFIPRSKYVRNFFNIDTHDNLLQSLKIKIPYDEKCEISETKKNKKKKKKKNKITMSNNTESTNYDEVQNQLLNQYQSINSLLSQFIIQESSRVPCNVTQLWLQKLEKSIFQQLTDLKIIKE